MTVNRDIFAELTEGFDALKAGRDGKPTPVTVRFRLAHVAHCVCEFGQGLDGQAGRVAKQPGDVSG